MLTGETISQHSPWVNLIMLQYHIKHPILEFKNKKWTLLTFRFSEQPTWVTNHGHVLVETDIQYTGTFSEITITFDLMRKQSLCPCQICLTQRTFIENKYEDMDQHLNVLNVNVDWCWAHCVDRSERPQYRGSWTASYRKV